MSSNQKPEGGSNLVFQFLAGFLTVIYSSLRVTGAALFAAGSSIMNGARNIVGYGAAGIAFIFSNLIGIGYGFGSVTVDKTRYSAPHKLN